MNQEEVLLHFEQQLALLKKEKAVDYAQYQERMMNTSIQERVKNGVTWYPIQIQNDYISTGERITVEVQRTKNQGGKHAFQSGVVVGIFSNDESKEKILQGVVGYLKEDTMRIVLNQDYIPDWVKTDRIGVNLFFDDGTYREMNKAIQMVMNAQNDRLAELRCVLFGLQQASINSAHTYDLQTLNEVQNQAFANIIHADDVAFVHGPPGTGKTTTLVKCIKEVVRTEKQVLVCAPSNAAVDLLVEKLTEEQVNVLRIGHPARLTPEVIENSLDVKISKHPEFGRLRELRKKSEEFRSLAGKYKRQFGRQERAQRNLMYKEAKALKQESKDIEIYITESLADRAEVIACTLTGASQRLVTDRIFKTVFIDESSQAMEAAAWIPILRSKRVIMSGDHHQLPPTIKSREAAKEGLEHTLFARGLRSQKHTVTMLETQYRMEPSIMGFSSEQFYQGKLKASKSVLNRPKFFNTNIRMVDTAGAGFEEKVKKETLSTYNEGEADILIKLMEEEKLDELSVGVILPYRAQVEVINKLLVQSDKLAPHLERIDVNSVDAFQGQERDVIFISLVRSNPNGEIGFLREYRRMNVAMTRARHRLVIVGDSSTIGIDPFFNKMLDYIQKHGTYQSVYELTSLMNFE